MASSRPYLFCQYHYNDVIMGSWRLKSPASPLFTQPFIRVQIKENIKIPRNWPLCGEFTGDRWIPREFPAQMVSNAKNVSIWWRHHDKFRIGTWFPKCFPRTKIYDKQTMLKCHQYHRDKVAVYLLAFMSWTCKMIKWPYTIMEWVVQYLFYCIGIQHCDLIHYYFQSWL